MDHKQGPSSPGEGEPDDDTLASDYTHVHFTVAGRGAKQFAIVRPRDHPLVPHEPSHWYLEGGEHEDIDMHYRHEHLTSHMADSKPTPVNGGFNSPIPLNHPLRDRGRMPASNTNPK